MRKPPKKMNRVKVEKLIINTMTIGHPALARSICPDTLIPERIRGELSLAISAQIGLQCRLPWRYDLSVAKAAEYIALRVHHRRQLRPATTFRKPTLFDRTHRL